MEHKSDDFYAREMVAISSKWTLPVTYTLKYGARRYSPVNDIPGHDAKSLNSNT